MEFRLLLLSDITLAEVQQKALAWATGPDIGKKPSIASLGRSRVRVRLEEQIARIEGIAVTRRATRNLLRRAVKGMDQEQILDEAMALIGQQAIDASIGMDGAATQTAAWLLLRRADQRRFDQRTAIFEAQSGSKDKQPPAPKEPPLTDEEKEAKWRQIFGMEPEQPVSRPRNAQEMSNVENPNDQSDWEQ